MKDKGANILPASLTSKNHLEEKMKVVQQGDTVKLHYKAKTKDEIIFDSTAEKTPLKITLGKQETLPLIEEAIIGMQIGESKSINIEADNAFGPYLKELITSLEKKELPSDIKLTEGQKLKIEQPDGSNIIVTITHISNETVTIDANHPLAGKDITFDIELLEIL